MKKIFLPLAVAAALLLGSKANAQIPEWINFQGVSTVISGEINVTFQILSEDGKQIYYEEHQNVKTNAKGAFQAKIGEGDPHLGDFDAIDWAGDTYKLNVTAGGVSTKDIEFASVPYAFVAKTLGSVSADDIEGMKADFDNVMDNLEMLTPVIDTLLEDVDTLKDGLATTQQDVIDLTEATRSNTAGLAALQAEHDAVVENLDMMTPVLQNMEDAIEELTNVADWVYNEAIPDLQNDLAQHKAAAAAEIDAINEGLATTQQDVIDLTEATRANTAGLAALETQFNNVLENLDMSAPLVESLTEKVEALEEGLATTQQDVIDLTEATRSNTAGLAALQAEHDAVVENLDMMIPVLQQMEDQVEELNNVADWVYNEAIPELQNDLAQHKAAAAAEIDAINEGLATTQQDVIDLTEATRSNTAGLAALQAEHDAVVENLDMMIPVLQQMEDQVEELNNVADWVYNEAIPELQMQVAQHKADVAAEIDAINEGLATTQQDVIDLTETTRSTAAGLAALEAEYNKVVENLDMMTPVLQEMEAQVEELTNVADWVYNEAIPELQMQVAQHKADTAAEIDRIDEALDVLSTDVNDLDAAYRENKTDIAELRLDVNTALELVNRAGTVAYETYEQVQDLAASLTETQGDVMNLVEDNMANKTKIEMNATAIDDLRVLVQLQGEAIGSLQAQVTRLQEVVNDLRK